MAKKNVKIIETMEFDSYAQAKNMVQTAQKKRTRILIGLVIAAIATFCTVTAFMGNMENAHRMAYSIVLAFPAYLIGGGIGSALKTAANLAIWGWRITRFPTDVFTGIFAFFASVFIFFFVPFIFVLMNFVKHNRDYLEAKKYLSYYRRTNSKEMMTNN